MWFKYWFKLWDAHLVINQPDEESYDRIQAKIIVANAISGIIRQVGKCCHMKIFNGVI